MAWKRYDRGIAVLFLQQRLPSLVSISKAPFPAHFAGIKCKAWYVVVGILSGLHPRVDRVLMVACGGDNCS